MTTTAADANFVEPAEPCGTCGHPASDPHLAGLVDFITGEPFDIERCRSCGLMTTRPLPDPASAGRYYPARYRGDRHAFTGTLRADLRRRAVEVWFPRGFKGRLLDIGCGGGTFARHMRDQGWSVAVTEIDPAVVAELSAEGIEAKLATDAEASGFDRPFDAVTSWHVMEHVDRPDRVARWARSQLADGGVFQPTVPNAGSLQARLFKRHWVHLDVPRHRHHFTPATFRRLLESAGFAVAGRSNFAIEYDWFGVIQSSLNLVCRRPNVLFEKLIGVDVSDAPWTDRLWSALLGPPIAAASFPALVGATALGDGATLTLTCRKS